MTRSIRRVEAPFLYLQGAAAWADPVASQGVAFDEALAGLRLGDARATPIALDEPGGTLAGLTQPTGLAVGADNRLFLADPAGNQILTYTTHQAQFLPLWPARLPAATTPGAADCRQALPASPEPPDPYTLLTPRGVAISPDGDLVVADTGHARVIFYRWPSLVARHIIQLPAGEPWDLAFDSRGRLYVADAKANRVHRFDRLWRRDQTYNGGEPLLNLPRHLIIDAEDRVIVVNTGVRPQIDCETWQPLATSGFAPIVELDEQGRATTELKPSLFQRQFPPPLQLDQSGLSLPQACRPRCPALPLPGLRVDRLGRLLGRGLYLLALPATVRFPRTGRFVTAALDSKIFQCLWHRLLFDVELPQGTSLSVRTLTDPAKLDASRVADLPDSRWSRPLTIGPDDPPEILVQSGPGQVLWVELTMTGNGAATPLIRALTIYAPRASSLGYLPPVFFEDPVSADFLTVFAEIESQIERFSGYLDPDGAPAGDFLRWLASWLDIEFLAEWPEATQREFVRRAIALYKQRGTIAGLQAILKFHSGLPTLNPIVIEHFRLRNFAARREPSGDLVNDQLYISGLPLAPADDEVAHQFTVVVPSQLADSDAALTTLHRLIEAQKPAHTGYQLRVVEPGVRIGCQSTIGVDMLIGSYPSAPLGEMKLAASSQLPARRTL
jgi:phage tail-like protein